MINTAVSVQIDAVSHTYASASTQEQEDGGWGDFHTTRLIGYI